MGWARRHSFLKLTIMVGVYNTRNCRKMKMIFLEHCLTSPFNRVPLPKSVTTRMIRTIQSLKKPTRFYRIPTFWQKPWCSVLTLKITSMQDRKIKEHCTATKSRIIFWSHMISTDNHIVFSMCFWNSLMSFFSLSVRGWNAMVTHSPTLIALNGINLQGMIANPNSWLSRWTIPPSIMMTVNFFACWHSPDDSIILWNYKIFVVWPITLTPAF